MKPATDARHTDIAKIHIAKSQLGMSEEDYRAMLRKVGGADSAADLDSRGRGRVLAHLKRCGWLPQVPRGKTRTRPVAADSPQARKVRSLWLLLHDLEQVRDPSERALAHFCKRITGADALQWTDRLDKPIEALKDWALRALPAHTQAMREQLAPRRHELPPQHTAALHDALVALQQAQHKRHPFDEYAALHAALAAALRAAPPRGGQPHD